MIKRTTGDKIFDFFNAVFLWILILTTLYPFLYVLFCVVKHSFQTYDFQRASVLSSGAQLRIVYAGAGESADRYGIS